jgi:hypothetical protein
VEGSKPGPSLKSQYEVYQSKYLASSHFTSATFEKWESEFLQMAIYVILTTTLRQEGSSEYKKLKGQP